MSGPSAAGPTWPTALAMAATLASRGGPYLALLIAARLLSADSFGAYALAAVCASLLGALVSGGGSLWTNRYASAQTGVSVWRDAARQRYLEICLILATAVLLTASIILIAAPDRWRTLIVAAAAAAIVTGLAEAALSVLRSAGQVSFFFIVRDLAIPLTYLGLLILLQPSSAAAALALLPLAAGVPLLLGITRLNRLGLLSRSKAGRGYRGTRLHTLWRYTATLIGTNLIGRLAAYLDVLMLGVLVTVAWVGEYRAAAQLALGFTVVQNAVFLGLPWQLRHQGGEAERTSRRAQIRARQRLLAGSAALALLAVLTFAPELLALFGPEFVGMADLLRLLCAVRFLDLLWGPQPQLLISNGLAHKDVGASLLSIVVWLGGFAALQGVLPTLVAAAAAHGLASPCGQLLRWQALRSAAIPPPVTSTLALNGLALCYAFVLIMTYLSGR